ncbi:MAG: carboxypeptidase-like regulatory domain-containing protein [Planctomycetota bacterium]|nr:carboxypeptidase-like regulatory domain-containing protein [Planctomycetota bacterium]
MLLVALLFGSGAALVVLWFGPGDETAARADPEPAAGEEAPIARGETPTLQPVLADDAGSRARTAEGPFDPMGGDLAFIRRPGSGDNSRFRGANGSLRGHVDTAAGTAFPRTWRLVFGPSRTLIGRDRAEERVIEFTGGEQDFVVSNLPLAGYDVRPEAEGMNGLRHPVMIDRHNTSPYVVLRLSPAGFLEGRLVDTDGAPVEGVPVTLEAITTSLLRETTTGLLGNYRFDAVLDGEYKLVFGHRTSPLVPPEFLRFSAPSMSYPERALPRTGRLEILVLGPYETPVAGAQLVGSGTKGGYVRGETDFEGKLEVVLLPPGRYRITARHEEFGRSRRAIDVVEGQTKHLTIELGHR